MNKSRFPKFFITIVFCSAAGISPADPPVTESDFAMLPPYCKARAGKTSQSDQENWKRRIGRNGWVHMHHYCSALDSVNKANLARGNESQTYNLKQAVNNFNYVQENWSPTYFLLPEVSLKKGKSLLRLNQWGAAIEEFNLAIKLNPKYSPAYAALSDFYSDQGDKEQAISIVKQGLKSSPNSKSLKRRLKKLQ